MAYRRLTRNEHFQAPGPKRILALDGGGLRGILTLGFLGRIEKLLGERHGVGADFRLSDYFDLIAGTSTGAIIAAALATGLSVKEIVCHYERLGREVFRRNPLRWGVVRARYDEGKLISRLKEVLGEDTTLGSEELETGLLVVTKRMDTGSPWPLGNNPCGLYSLASPGDDWISNRDYPLWKVVRASTAAPLFFDPERITIIEKPGREPVIGDFVDGGVSPFNNPALQAFMYATLDGFHVKWPTGADRLLLVSVGTGSPDPSQAPSRLAAKGAVKALLSLMDDCAALGETLMQWMSSSPRAREIDSEIGDLRYDLIAESPLLTYLRYDLLLTRESVEPLVPRLSKDSIKSLGKMEVESLSRMDQPKNLGPLRELGVAAAAEQVLDEHFPHRFDLPASD